MIASCVFLPKTTALKKNEKQLLITINCDVVQIKTTFEKYEPKLKTWKLSTGF